MRRLRLRLDRLAAFADELIHGRHNRYFPFHKETVGGADCPCQPARGMVAEAPRGVKPVTKPKYAILRRHSVVSVNPALIATSAGLGALSILLLVLLAASGRRSRHRAGAQVEETVKTLEKRMDELAGTK